MARINPSHAAARAARGAAYLDGVDPSWYRALDADGLSLADGGACVLGQRHGTFRDGLWRARLVNGTSAPRASLSPVAYGFLAVDSGDAALAARDYTHLDAAWRAEIAARLEREVRPAPPAEVPKRRPAATLASVG